MGSVGRAIGTLALTIGGSLLGPAGFATYGAAIGSFVGGVLFAPSTGIGGFRLDTTDTDTYDYGTAIKTCFGRVGNLGGTAIDGRYVDGIAKCIEEEVKSSKKGGILGIGAQTVKEYRDYYSVAVMWSRGVFIQDRIWFVDGKERKLIYNRDGEDDDKKGFVLTPHEDDDGNVVCELSDGLDLFHGYDSQPVSSYLQSQHPEGVPAYRPFSYCILKRFRLRNGQGKLVCEGHSPITGRRQIIERIIGDSNLPAKRLYLDGLDENISSHISGGGAIFDGTTKRSDFIQQIALLGLNDLGHVDGLVVNRSRLSPLYHILQLDELGAHEWSSGENEPPDLIKIQPVNVVELPSSIRIEFQDINLNYQSNWVVSRRETATHTNDVTITLPIASTQQEMQWLADTLLDEYSAAIATVEVQLLPRRLNVAVGDVLMVPDDSTPTPTYYVMRVTEQSISPEGIVACKGLLYDSGVYGQYRAVEEVVLPQDEVTVYEAPKSVVFDIPAIDDSTATSAGLILAAAPPYGTGWTGAVFTPSIGDSQLLDLPATLGKIVSAVVLPESSARSIDYGTTLRVQLESGTFAPAVDEAAVRNDKANTLLIQTLAGVAAIQFVDAVSVDPRTWDITGLLAGRYGTDYAMSIPANAPCVLLNDVEGKAALGIEWFSLSDSQLGSAFTYTVDTDDDNAKNDGNHSVTPVGNTLVPLSPVRVRQLVTGGANVTLQWDARTRLQPGISWSMTRVSDPDNYEVRLFDGMTLKLTKTVNATQVVFTLSELTAAFGTLPDSLTGDVCQLSNRVGRGHRRVFSLELN